MRERAGEALENGFSDSFSLFHTVLQPVKFVDDINRCETNQKAAFGQRQ